MKGLQKITMEFLLMAIGHNLRKMAAKVKKEAPYSIFSCTITFMYGKTPKKELFRKKIIELYPIIERMCFAA